MLAKTLFILLLIVAMLAIAAFMDTRRQRSLRIWIDGRADARLYSNFDLNHHSSIPAEELTALFMQRPPIAWASAVQVSDVSGEVWFIEFRATPIGKESSQWFTLVASQKGPAGEESKAHGGWVCHLRHGLINVSLLEEVGSFMASQNLKDTESR